MNNTEQITKSGKVGTSVKVNGSAEKYIKTKLGLIPESWKIKSLGQIGVFSKGKGINKSEVKENGLPCIRYAEIYTKYQNYTELFTSFIDKVEASNSREIFHGDLLFAGSGETLEDIGKCIAYMGPEPAFAGGDIIILRPKDVDSKFLGFLLNQDETRKQTHKLGQGHSVVHIYSSGLKNLKVSLPTLPEQQKIAKVLCTWDIAILKQEQLIRAKETFKKGLMQLLLTGKRRFEGFEDEWEEIKLNNIGAIFTGGTPSSEIPSYWNGSHIWYTPSEIKGAGKYIDDSLRKISSEGLAKSSAKIFPKMTIVICTRATIGELSISLVEACTNQGFKNLKPNKNHDVEFIYYVLKSSKIDFLRKSCGSTFLELSTNDFRNIKIRVPALAEQLKIASVLSDVDKENGLLRQQLIELEDQKRGLMQQLLTGSVRVKINNEK